MSLRAWWKLGYERFVESFSAFDAADPARIFRGLLSRSAERLVRAASVDQAGALFSSACAALGAICYLLDLELTEADWASARADALASPGALQDVHASMLVRFVSSPEAFRQDALQALLAAGVVPDVRANVDEESRRAALELAANYLMRFLIAYASQCSAAEDPAVVGFQQLAAE